MKVHIIYNNYLIPDGSEMSIGGIQTYITELKEIITELGYEVIVHQRADIDFDKVYSGVRIKGYKLKIKRGFMSKLLAKAIECVDQDKDLVIFGCETNALKKLRCKTIGIQHGISWDKPGKKDGTIFTDLISYVKKSIKGYQTVNRISNVDILVCVDYNFVNWYRAVVAYPHVKLSVNTNFCKIPSSLSEKPRDVINIIFARRFFPYRGTRIFVDAISKICDKYSNVRVTIAGSGPDEEYMKKNLSGDAYSFIRYDSKDTLAIHEDKHIAIVPTLGSEGTSLSLLESMAAGCVPVCTNVGGMTNIILDHFNGLIINPISEELYDALDELVENELLRRELAYEAYHTVKKSFNYLKWKNKWIEILDQSINDKNVNS